MKKLLSILVAAAGLLVSALPSVAQLTPAQVQAEINAQPWNNASGQITGAIMQQLLNDMVSLFPYYAPLTSPSFSGTVNLPSLTLVNGVPFAASAFTNALNASNISSGTLPIGRIGQESLTTALLGVGSGGYVNFLSPSIGGVGDGATSNAQALANVFARTDNALVFLPPGIYEVPCSVFSGAVGQVYYAQSAISLVGAGAEQTIIQLQSGCTVSADFMIWDAKSGVVLRDLTLDLNNPATPPAVQTIVGNRAYSGNAMGLLVSNFRIINGTDKMLLHGVAAAAGHTFENPIFTNNYYQISPGKVQNECIVFTTLDGAGSIADARVTGNVCNGTGLQADGHSGLWAYNAASNVQYGAGLFATFITSGTTIGDYNNVFIGNEFHNFPAGVDVNYAAPAGIESSCQSCTFIANYVHDVSGAGFLNFGNDALLQGNLFKNNARNYLIATTGASGTGTTATLTFGGGVSYTVGNTITVAGVTPSGYNGTYVVTASSVGSVSYANTTTGAQTIAGTIAGWNDSASGLCDLSAICVATSSVLPAYNGISNNFQAVGNVAYDDAAGTQRYAYYEQPGQTGANKLRGNSFSSAQQDYVITASGTTVDVGSIQTKTSPYVVTAINFVGLDTQSYHSWELECHDLLPASAGQLGVRVTEDGGATWKSGSNYATNQTVNGGGAVADYSSATLAGLWLSPDSWDASGAYLGSFRMHFGNLGTTNGYKLAEFTAGYFKSLSNIGSLVGSGGWIGDQGAINGLQVVMASGGNFYGSCTLKGFPQ